MDEPKSKRIRNSTENNDMIYEEDLDALMIVLDESVDGLEENFEQLCNATVFIEPKQSSTSVISDTIIKQLLRESLKRKGYEETLAENCYTYVKDDLMVFSRLHHSEDELLKHLGCIMRKTYNVKAMYYGENKIFSNTDLKNILGITMPLVIAKLNDLNHASNKSEKVVEELTTNDTHIIRYLEGSVLRWLKGKVSEQERSWCEEYLQSEANTLSEKFEIRNRKNKLLNISDSFYNVLLCVEKNYREKRHSQCVPMSEIVDIDLSKHFCITGRENWSCMEVALKRYVRMRAYFNTKSSLSQHLAKKVEVKKSNAIRKHLKLYSNPPKKCKY